MKRIFLVGCPRSGTTLLQSILASHPDIISFPETHLFSKTISINSLVRFFTIYGEKHIDTLREICKDLGVSDNSVSNIKTPVFSTKGWIAVLLDQLDAIANHFSPKELPGYLLEKTPRHLHFINEIQSVAPEAQFIHIIRKGEDVVASLHQATSNSPEHWEGSRSLKKSVFWWNRSIRISSGYIGKRNQHFVLYQDLIDHPEKTVSTLLEKLNFSYSDDLFDSFNETAESLINKEETWKAKNYSSELSTSQKFEQLTSDEQNYVKRSLISFDYSGISINAADNGY
ncbi:MAG: sulfotransferase [Balneolaceae bacterium]|nr:sulfotransferase [Balneolaceae bacterium]MBO6547420.1 sulfotransferase [Balneolaceae bacterium]MBO6647633.1 sulfotransferase [Balneolaceae bacterium]